MDSGSEPVDRYCQIY